MVDLSSYKRTLNILEKETLNLTEIWSKTSIYDDENQFTELTIDNLTFDNFKEWHYKQDHNFEINILYLDDIKCFNFGSPFNKTARHLNLNHQRLFNLYTASFDLQLVKKLKQSNVFVFLNRDWMFDFDWKDGVGPADYHYEITVIKSNYQDDYWHLKNLLSYLGELVGLSKPLNNMVLYLFNLRESFLKEQYATTTMIPLEKRDEKSLGDFPIKNRQVSI